MSEHLWTMWMMQTARHYGDVATIIFETGIQEIDDDHRKMVGQVLEINNLIDNLDHHNFSLELIYRIGELCERLRQTNAEHFKREEAILRAHNLPSFPDHAKKHGSILLELNEMIADLAKGKLTVTHDLKLAVLDWVIVHINQEDAQVFSVDSFRSAILRHRSPDKIKEMFLPVDIPHIDQQHHAIHLLLMNPMNERSHWTKLIDNFSEACRHEEILMEQWPIPDCDEHRSDHTRLLQLFKQGLHHPEKLLDAHRRQCLLSWCRHHRSRHIGSINTEAWIPGYMQRTVSANDIAKLVPALNIEELDQGRRLSHRLLYRLYSLFNRLEVDPQNPKSNLDFSKTLKKFRGHLRFQYELEDDLLEKCDPTIAAHHRDDHQEILATIDYWGVLMQSSQLELASAIRRKLVAKWLNHLMFYDQVQFRPFNGGLI